MLFLGHQGLIGLQMIEFCKIKYIDVYICTRYEPGRHVKTHLIEPFLSSLLSLVIFFPGPFGLSLE